MSGWKVSRSSVALKVSFWILAPLVLTTCSLSPTARPEPVLYPAHLPGLESWHFHAAHAHSQQARGVQCAGPGPPPHDPSPRGIRRGVFASSRHATTRAQLKMAAAVLSGPSAGSAAAVPGGPGSLSAVGSGPRLRLMLLESVSGLLQPRTGSAVAPVHPPARSAPHLPGLMCLLRLHGTVGGAQVSP